MKDNVPSVIHGRDLCKTLTDVRKCSETGVAREAGKRVVILDIGAIPVITADHHKKGQHRRKEVCQHRS